MCVETVVGPPPPFLVEGWGNNSTVMCELLFVLGVSLLSECEGTMVTAMLVGDKGVVVRVNA